MSREIKFRVWEEREKAYNTWTFILDTLGNLFRNVYGALIGCNEKDYIVEQDTGLKDRNGKEIYEGDIVKWVNGLNDAMLYEVYFNECRATFLLNPLVDGEMIEGMSDKKKLYIEVIGNIHENPELLGGE